MLQAYYTELDPIKRKALLEEFLASDADAEEKAALSSLFDARYVPNKKGGYNDRFVGAWLEMKIVLSNRIGKLSRRRNEKQVAAAVSDLCLNRQEDFPPAMLYQELRQFLALYMNICARDHNYGSILWGLGRISDSRLRQKIEKDLTQIRDEIPSFLPDSAPFSLLQTVISDVLEEEE